MAQTRDPGVADTARWINHGDRTDFDVRTHLAHAAQQARERNFQDLLIVDVDAHQNLSSWAEVTPYIEDRVIRARAQSAEPLVPSVVTPESMAGRIWPPTQI